MDILQIQHEGIRTLASRELKAKFRINLKLTKLKSKKANPKNTFLGKPLENLQMVYVQAGSSIVPVPKVFPILVDVVKTDLKKEGLFRVEGKKTREKAILETLNKGDEMPDDVTVIEAAALIKNLLRNIPGHLIPPDISQWFYKAGKVDPSKMDEAVQLCVLLLPLRNLNLLVYLMEFFNEITKQSGSNKMTSSNLAVVVAPNIFPEFKHKDLQVQGEMSNLTLNITKSLIENYKSLQTVPHALINKLESLNEEEETSSSKLCKWWP